MKITKQQAREDGSAAFEAGKPIECPYTISDTRDAGELSGLRRAWYDGFVARRMEVRLPKFFGAARAVAAACLLLTAFCFPLPALAVDLADYPPDDKTDWGPSFQAAINDLKHDGGWDHESGGKIVLGPGRHRVTTPILVDCPGVIIEGCGNPFSYSCTIEWNNPDPKKALFTFVSPASPRSGRSNGFAMRDIRLVDYGNLKAGKNARVDTTAFRFAQSSRYSRDFCFDRVTANYFGTVFRTEGGGTWGGVCASNCTFVYNGQVVDATSGGAWNEWSFRDGLFHKNGLKAEGWPARYAFDFRSGSQGTFDACLLEAQPRALRLRDFISFRMSGCRFEGNATSGDPACLIEGCSGGYIRAFHRVVPAEEKPGSPPTIVLRNCTDYDDVKLLYGKLDIEDTWRRK